MPRAAAIAAIISIAILAFPMSASPTGSSSATRRVPGGASAGLLPDVAGVSAATPAPLTGPRFGRQDDALPRKPAPRALRQIPVDPAPADPRTLTGYRWPLRHARITNGFGKGNPGSFRIDGMTMHEGIDISSWCGAPIMAAHDGVVLVAGRHYYSYVGWVGDLGPFRDRLSPYGWRQQAIVVVIDDGNGYRSMYFHLSFASVKAGQVVRAGDRIGYQGETGAATGCHLHYALFSPLETRTLKLDPRIAERTRLPERAILRIDPLLVLPPASDAFIVWSWGARSPY